MTKLILHAVQDTGRYQRAEGVADQATAGQERRPKTELFASVPLRQQEERSWEECGLDEAEEEPRQQCADKATILLEIRTVTSERRARSLLRDTCQAGNHAPHDHTAWEVN